MLETTVCLIKWRSEHSKKSDKGYQVFMTGLATSICYGTVAWINIPLAFWLKPRCVMAQIVDKNFNFVMYGKKCQFNFNFMIVLLLINMSHSRQIKP